MRPESPEDLKPKTRADFTELGLAYRSAPIVEAFRGRLPTEKELRNITEELGVEIATSVFLRAIQEAETHGEFLKRVRGVNVEAWRAAHGPKPGVGPSPASSFEVVFVASNFFLSGRKWGEQVETWRKWARDLGFTTDVIETNPGALVAANARTIREHLSKSHHPNRILVTYGQGAAEMRFFLQHHLAGSATGKDSGSQALYGIRAWVNVCGAFSGAGASEIERQGLLSRLQNKLKMRLAGRAPGTLIETSPSFPLWRKSFQLPPGLLTLNLIGVPMRAQLPKRLNYHYDSLAKQMPNDGVVGIFEAVARPGLLLPITGMSHEAEDTKLFPYFQRSLILVGEALLAAQGSQP